MCSKFLKAGIALGVLVGVVLIPNDKVLAAELQKTDKTVNISKNYLADATAEIEKYVEVEMKDLYIDKDVFANMAFNQVEGDSYLYIRTESSADSEWVGKLYRGGAAEVIDLEGDWAKVQSGNVTGYVKAEHILTGEQAEAKAKAIIAEKKPEVDLERLNKKTANAIAAECFSFAESKEEEAERIRKQGQAVVDYAMQFVGNPYRWGGTSLTRGADCSGFVKAVYANFGIGMPRTSGSMRRSGVEVSYSEAMPGDVICYSGHVGIYVGNGKIVNAIDEKRGIGISSATYANIITVRRLFK